LIVTGGITGSLSGSIQSATSASYALTASWAPGGIAGLATKSGVTGSGAFTGTPRKATITFTSSFATANYAVVVTGDDARSWTIESKVAGSFVINSNSSIDLAGSTYWIATAYGET
jgi:hypothetical protein